MGGAFGTVDDAIFIFWGRDAGELSVRCGTDGGAETIAQGQRGASRRDSRVLAAEKRCIKGSGAIAMQFVTA
ncbi:hypothetical protein H9L39_08735 [Fusarium oxysporum f. sp. albedinis]|jgi:hypothetical protein|nr:hypothetical protein H9L39_08735 [Fusarium oxysporum f. sp. albedinis]